MSKRIRTFKLLPGGNGKPSLLRLKAKKAERTHESSGARILVRFESSYSMLGVFFVE